MRWKEDRMATRVYHTVNCGLYFENENTGVLFDGVFQGHHEGYSDTSEETIENIIQRKAPYSRLKALLFTHRHHDHFNEEAVDRILSLSRTQLYAPEYEKSNAESLILRPDVTRIKIGSMLIYAIRTLHDGDANLRAEPHVSYVINTEDETFFIAGDAIFRQGEAEKIDHFCDHWVEAAFVNPYQTLQYGDNLTFLRKMDPRQVFLIHKPYPEDDAYNIYIIFRTAARRYPADLPELIEPDFDSWIL